MLLSRGRDLLDSLLHIVSDTLLINSLSIVDVSALEVGTVIDIISQL